MQNIQDITQAIEREIGLFKAIFTVDNPRLGEAPAVGKWTPLQHLDHLAVSARRVNQVLAYVPKWVLRWRFGRPNRPARTYDELVARYLAKLAVANPPNNPFSSGTAPYEQRATQWADFERQHKRLARLIGAWKETDLDRYLVPHPLLGKLLVRELFYFMAYHMEHHRTAIERDLG